MDVIHFVIDRWILGVPDAACGAQGGAVTANHKRVTCGACRASEQWRKAHEIRWGGRPCECDRGTAKTNRGGQRRDARRARS